MTDSNQQQDPVKPSEQRRGTALHDKEAREKGGLSPRVRASFPRSLEDPTHRARCSGTIHSSAARSAG
jgi:hypothetical protein